MAERIQTGKTFFGTDEESCKKSAIMFRMQVQGKDWSTDKGKEREHKREETKKRPTEEVQSCKPTSYSIVPRVLLLSRQTQRQVDR